VECARFKGTTTDVFIDQKSITTNIAIQAEEAYNFVLRHINRGATVEGVYTVSQWEYPVKAVREAIRNAIVHRDYSLAGKDVKVAIYDDMIEITSPGLLPPSIDFSAMNSRQSDARNKVVAPVFLLFFIIDQWGNGLKLIADELKAYPQIGFQWKDSGLSFQIQFVKLDFVEGQELRAELGQELQQDSDIEQQKTRADLRAELQQEQQDLQQEFGAGLGQGLQQEQQKPGQELGQEQQDLRQELQQDLQQELQKQTLYSVVLQCLVTEILARQEISNALGHKKGSGQLNKVILKLIENKLIERTIPENLNHPMQKFRITQRGKMFLELLTNR
jgi:predicted HTH transcriptional regulator